MKLYKVEQRTITVHKNEKIKDKKTMFFLGKKSLFNFFDTRLFDYWAIIDGHRIAYSACGIKNMIYEMDRYEDREGVNESFATMKFVRANKKIKLKINIEELG